MNTFSIIIPTFNSASDIANALTSVLNQTFQDFEVIVVDGLSKDETLNIVGSFQDKRIKVISEKDYGIYDAMNKGIRTANGQWLYFLGSDDSLYDNDVLGNVHGFISNTSSKVVYGNVVVKGNTGWANDGQVYDGEFDLEKLLNVNIAHQAIFYHRSVFSICGKYNLHYKVCADYDMNLRVASRFKMDYMNIKVSNFNAGGASTLAKDENFEADIIYNLCRYYSKQLLKPEFRKYRKSIINEGKKQIKQLNLLKGIHYVIIGTYLKFSNRLS